MSEISDTSISFDLIDGDLHVQISSGAMALTKKLTVYDLVHAASEVDRAYAIARERYALAPIDIERGRLRRGGEAAYSALMAASMAAFDGPMPPGVKE